MIYVVVCLYCSLINTSCKTRRGSTLGPGAQAPQLLLRPPVSFNALSRWNWIARNRVGNGDQAPRIFGLEPRLVLSYLNLEYIMHHCGKVNELATRKSELLDVLSSSM
jgi:hypothetical protein